MKPNFALDLSHDGISLLHRGKGGWTLVGEVALDDPDIGARLDELRKTAAQLESGGFTTKLIIPNSQILYTTLDAPGPDDIAREVQIRAGLEGLTPYAVGDLVFDWRAKGKQARVAVCARETMDEAESFATEYRLNPVSFVGRPDRDDFSGEPFFGKSKAASRLLASGERLEPDTSPVPRRPRALELPAAARIDVGLEPAPEPQPAAAGLVEASGFNPGDPFAALSQLDDLPDPVFDDDEAATAGAAPDKGDTPRKTPRSRGKDSGSGAVSPPVLAPFPPTPDEVEDMPVPTPVTRAAPAKPKTAAPKPAEAKAPDLQENPKRPIDAPVPPQARDTASGPTARAQDAPRVAGIDFGKADTTDPGTASPEPQDAGAQPELSFASRRAGGEDGGKNSGETAPAERVAAMSPRIGIGGAVTDAIPPAPATGPTGAPAPAGAAPTMPPARRDAPAPSPVARVSTSPLDRLHGEMADALSRPLPSPGDKPEKQKDGPGVLTRLGSAARGAAGKASGLAGTGLRSTTALARDGAAASRERFAAFTARKGGAESATDPGPKAAPAPAPAPADGKSAGKGFGFFGGKDSRRSEAEEIRAREAEALTVFGARKSQDAGGKPRYLGLILTLVLLLLMAVLAVWSNVFLRNGEASLFNPGSGSEVASTDASAPVLPLDETQPAAPSASTPEADPAPGDLPAGEEATPLPLTGEVLSPEAAEARYAATGIWQRAPEPLANPEASRLNSLEIAAIVPVISSKSTVTLPAEAGQAADGLPATPLPPPPVGTTFDLDESGLVRATAEGAVSPMGILVYAGKPALVPPARPGALVPPETEAPGQASPPGPPELRPQARPADLVPDDAALATPADTTAQSPATGPETAELHPSPRPGDLAPADTAAPVEVATAAIDAAVEEVIEDAFAGASELAVARSPKPTHRPADIARLVDAAQARASDGSQVIAAAAAPAAPLIPASANVATRATMENALNLREINLIGIYGTSSSRRALVRLDNGRYVKVEVGDRLDGGKVTSISATRLTYQKGSRAYTLDVLPLG